MKVLRLDDIEGIPVFGTLVWKPVRKTLGVTAFGINAYTAANAGDEVVEEHTEEQLGHEEIYAVISGRATFTVDGEEVDAPAGTLVYLDDVDADSARDRAGGRHDRARDRRRSRHARDLGVGVLLPGARADAERRVRHGARTILEEALAEKDAPVMHYQLACVEALAGNRERALDELQTRGRATADRLRASAQTDEDFASIRDDPRFPK